MRLLFFALCLSLLPLNAAACSAESECILDSNRFYRLYLPEGPGPHGALLFAHGYGGGASEAARNPDFHRLAQDYGLAIVALDASAPDWRLAHRPFAADDPEAQEFDYVADVLNDLPNRFDLDPSRVVMSGFSAGGMLTWTIACGMSAPFAGFVPYAGTFWAPVPERCEAQPTNIIHIHGDADPVVPLAGRQIGAGRQGDVAAAMALYQTHGQFDYAGSRDGALEMRCDTYVNPDHRILERCLFPGGHSFRLERLRDALDRVFAAG